MTSALNLDLNNVTVKTAGTFAAVPTVAKTPSVVVPQATTSFWQGASQFIGNLATTAISGLTAYANVKQQTKTSVAPEVVVTTPSQIGAQGGQKPLDQQNKIVLLGSGTSSGISSSWLWIGAAVVGVILLISLLRK